MKRTPIQRHTPLRSSFQLHRTSGINPVSKKRQRENRERKRVVSAMRELAYSRCARCGKHTEVHGHERRGGAYRADSILSPDCLLCNPCNDWASNGNVRAACWTGWRVVPKWPHDPALEPWEARALNGDVIDLRVFQCEVA